MIHEQLSSAEVDFIIYLSRYQDDYGTVSGVYYKELCEKMDMSYQTFYNVKRSLEEKGFIRSEKRNKQDHDITIVGNVFASMEEMKQGYVNTNTKMFYDKAFFDMKAGAKLLAMKMMRMAKKTGLGKYIKNTKEFLAEYTTLFGVKDDIMRIYLNQIREFFSILIRKRNYHIRPKEKRTGKYTTKDAMSGARFRSEKERYRKHMIDTILRRFKIQKYADKKNMDNLDYLFSKYGKSENYQTSQSLLELISRAVKKSIELILIGADGKEQRQGVTLLQPAIIHKLLQQQAGY